MMKDKHNCLIIKRSASRRLPKYIVINLPNEKSKKILLALKRARIKNVGRFLIVYFVKNQVFISEASNGITKKILEPSPRSLSFVEFYLIMREFERWTKY